MPSDVKKSVHCEAIRTGFLEGDAGSVRMVSESYPLPVFRNPASLTAGTVSGWSVVHKFGRNLAVGTTFAPITEGGIYRTPQVSAATALRIKAGGNANDTAAGSGAREITLQGLDETGAYVEETLATAGASASSPTTTTFLRLFRLFVSASGTYATATTSSHAADIVVEDAAGTQDWATIRFDGLGLGQSLIGSYTVPLGYTAYVTAANVFTDSTKTTDLVFFKRDNILATSPPYDPMRAQLDVRVQGAGRSINFEAPLGPFGPLTDIGFLGRVGTGSAETSVDFEIWLREDAA